MAGPKLRLSEEFLVLFNSLREATKYDPNKLKRFYDQSETIRNAANQIFWFVFNTKLDRLAEHGQRFHKGLPKRFSADYEDYRKHWKNVISEVVLPIGDIGGRPDHDKLPDTERPDFTFDDSFDPRRHNAGQVIDIGWGHLADEVDDELKDEELRNLCSVAIQGSDYIREIIGLDLVAVSDRWRRIPVTYVPDHVSTAGGDQAGSLFALLDDAMRAYVCGAPHAAIAMCRAVLERLLAAHYGRGDIVSDKLDNLIDLCAQRYTWVAKKKQSLHGIRRLANKSLHSPTDISILGKENEGILLAAFADLKFLIEKAPKA